MIIEEIGITTSRQIGETSINLGAEEAIVAIEVDNISIVEDEVEEEVMGTIKIIE